MANLITLISFPFWFGEPLECSPSMPLPLLLALSGVAIFFSIHSVCHHEEILELQTCQQQLCFCSRFGVRVMMLPCFDTNTSSIRAAKTIGEWLLKLWCHHLKKVAIKRNYNQILIEMSRISRCISSAKNCFDSKPSLNQWNDGEGVDIKI